MATGPRYEVLWSPSQPEKFLTFGNDLTLYKVEDQPGKAQVQKISDEKFANLVSINADNQYNMKCVAWYPKGDPEDLLAVGLTHGRVVLTNFGQEPDPHGLVGKTFVPKHGRTCNSLAWNPIDSNLLAAGFGEKSRTDYSILIWDINAKPSAELSSTPERNRTTSYIDSSFTVTKAMTELGLSETSTSLAWSYHNAATFITGMNNKFIRVFDIRDPTRPMKVALTKAVYGISADPHSAHRLASYCEGQLTIWDLRNFDKPVFTINEKCQINRLSWCPTRMGLLAVLPKDHPTIKLYDVQHATFSGEDVEPAVIERTVQPYPGNQTMSSFAWHPTDENRMITITPSGIIKDITVFERIALAWSPHTSVIWSCGKKLLQGSPEIPNVNVEDDISIKMKRRAKEGYGLKTDQLSDNGELTGDPQLEALWSWLCDVKTLREEGKIRNSGKNTIKMPGVKSVVQGELNGTGVCMRSEEKVVEWEGLDWPLSSVMYKSEDRTRTLQLCGWNFSRDDQSLDGFLKELEEDEEYERAAAIALFNLKLRKTIEILKRGASSSNAGDLNLNVVAMALSGYTDDKNTLWCEMCSSLCQKLHNPYLKAMFAFLISNNDGYTLVLSESEMKVQDRVAFACHFLSDAGLAQYVGELTKEMINDGNLQGILLTGLTKDGVDLIERYVDKSSDVQTASLVMLQAFPSEISKDSRVEYWIDCYRSLLDRWRLWHESKFDVYRSQCDAQSRPAQQVFISCNFCGKSIASNMITGTARARFMTTFGVGIANKSKINSCPGCRKPLPRCALCLINMGTPSAPPPTCKPKDETEDVGKRSQFNNWFTWCQTCRHGGHAFHMTQWFTKHTECPVTSCKCKCMTMDGIGTVTSTTKTES
ncbi:GATOR2 complex protein MIOS-like [Ptychodera flava]|uniref:GATOR2 complex protein MIOS-like n=1 Tax=Ptychodera flava TaxID=63121 RepID=UPI003969C852